MISNQWTDIISLKAVVEGHPFPVTFKFTLHKHWDNPSSRWWIHDSICTNVCRSMLMKTAWLTSQDGRVFSFGCKSSMNLHFDASLVPHHSLTNNREISCYRIWSHYRIWLIQQHLGRELFQKSLPGIHCAMCYCPIWQDPIWYEISKDRAVMQPSPDVAD